ncbi:Protein of unknown function [Deinococcus reticulitermitis]|uniref:DUF3732 domain-containing protein n=1 Tax=Deinococcus reticulitermitis TaxID=856736 RepID=A0A1H6SE76_9DEIO|nr:DUF3732 domain-containing protein [Deinococcus reticulitermitis]SEI66221.1 Protein of unknown function [Deinococcus reticulitermitis]
MQIRAIVLYSKSGKRRILPLYPGVNIITGRSGTGKSSLIRIVDYCLGSSRCDVAFGPIRDTVAWYGLLLRFADGETFIARENPAAGATTTNRAFIVSGNPQPIPETLTDPNTTSETVQEFINAKLGIAPNLHTPPEGQSREPLAANFRHALLFSFQEQDEIATQRKLFHRQDEFMMPQAIKDTLPYFLGVVREDALKLEQELREARRQLRRVLREQRANDEVRGEGLGRAIRFLAEARELGLIPEDFNESLNNLEATLAVLDRVRRWTPDAVPASSSSRLDALLRRRPELEDQREAVKDRLEAMLTFASEREGYEAEREEEVLRLESVHLYRVADDHDACPLCGGALDAPVPGTRAISSALADVEASLAGLQRDRPRLREQIDDLQRQRAEVDRQLRENYEEIQAVYAQDAAARALRDVNVARGRVAGRVDLWLDSVNIENQGNLQRDVDLARARVERLDGLLAEDEKTQRLVSVLVELSGRMTGWADRLQLEHAGGNRVLFDWSPLTVTVETPTQKISLRQMGSGENWLAYHLIVHFALHTHFVTRERPTPRFLMLDQPTQVYYPEEDDALRTAEETGALALLSENDRAAVQRMFDFVFDVTGELGDAFQVIVTEHADLREDERFQNAVIERWRDGEALIPREWLEELALSVETD